MSVFTFHYVSIISIPPSRPNLWLILIYIPLCFYYFASSRTAASLYLHLHSIMFLLFRRYLAHKVRNVLIYIPLCFYYFFSVIFLSMSSTFIYIPLCFYYFGKTDDEIRESVIFTFHYVSIISRAELVLREVRRNLHSIMFLLFPTLAIPR